MGVEEGGRGQSDGGEGILGPQLMFLEAYLHINLLLEEAL